MCYSVDQSTVQTVTLAAKQHKAKRKAGRTAAAFAYGNDISFEL